MGGGVSGAAIAGFAGSRALGIEGVYGSLIAALFAILYFERMRYPKLLITVGPHGARIASEDLRSTTLDIGEKNQLIFDGRRLEIRDEGSHKRIVLFRQDFPDIDFDALWQRLVECSKRL